MNPSPFFTLPAELRNRIYEDVLVRPNPILAGYFEDENLTYCKNSQQKNLPALLAVCTQIRREGFEMFYAGNQFGFSNLNAEAEMGNFMCDIGPKGCRDLREVSVVGKVDREGYLVMHTLGRPHASDEERKGMVRREFRWVVRIQCTQETRFRRVGDFLETNMYRHDLKNSLERLDSVVMKRWTRGIGYVIRESVEAVAECLEECQSEIAVSASFK